MKGKPPGKIEPCNCWDWKTGNWCTGYYTPWNLSPSEHGFCSNPTCIRSEANKTKRHGERVEERKKERGDAKKRSEAESRAKAKMEKWANDKEATKKEKTE